MTNKKNAQQIMNTGILNESIKGYLIQACKNAKITDREQIKDLLCGLSWALDEKTAEETEQIYLKF